MKNKKNLIVIGGGFGGVNVIKKLAYVTTINITLIDTKNYHLFQPLLYQVASAALDPSNIAKPFRDIFRTQQNLKIMMAKVIKVDKVLKKVVLEDNTELEFDYLVIGTGNRHTYFGHDNWEQFAPGLKTLDDALNIKNKLISTFEKVERSDSSEGKQKELTFVVVGGGPTGVEVAGAIAEIGNETLLRNFRNISPKDIKVFLIEGGNQILNTYPEDLSARAVSDLESLGVEVLTNTIVTSISKDGVQIGNKFIESSNVIWAAGNKASSLLRQLETPLDNQGRIIVNKRLNIADHDNIFVVGDAAGVHQDDGSSLPAVAPVAISQGKFVGKIISSLCNGQKFHQKAKYSYYDPGYFATIGKNKAVANIYGVKVKGFIAWFLWALVHIIPLVSFRNKIIVILNWVVHYISGRRASKIVFKNQDNEI